MILDTQDAVIQGIEDLSFTAVATSENILYTTENIKLRKCGR